MPWWKPTKPFLAEVVPWRQLADLGVVRNHDQSLMRIYAMRGPDLTGLSAAHQGSLMESLNRAFQQVPGHWSVHDEAQRVAVTSYPQTAATDPVLRAMDAQRRRDIVEGPSLETQYYLTIRRAPLKPLTSRLWNVLMTRPPTPRKAHLVPETVREFREHADHLVWLLRGVLSTCEPLNSSALLTYLHSTVSDRWHPVGVPSRTVDLNWQLCDTRFTGGWEPHLGICRCLEALRDGVPNPKHRHLGFCSLLSYPEKSMAPALERLDHLPFGHRRMTRWIAWHRQAARGVFRRRETVWLGHEKSVTNIALETYTGQQSRVVDSHATNQAMDADAARQEVSGGYVGYGNFTTVVMVWGATVEEAEARIGAVQQIFEDEGFNAIIETEFTSEAFLAMIPGEVRASVRRKPMSTLNVAHMAPGLKASWPGPMRDDHLQAPPWFLAHTEGTTLLRVVNHVLDVGHTVVLGPTGAGKSAFLDFTAAMWLITYWMLHARVIRLDIGGSGRALALCLGGQYDDLMAGTVAFQPLAEIHVLRELRSALEWLLDQCDAEGIPRAAEGYLRLGLERLASAPPSHRTLPEFRQVLTQQSNITERGLARAQLNRGDSAIVQLQTRVKEMLDNLIAHGLLNGSSDGFRESWFHIIELGTLLDETRLANALLPYLNRRIRRTFTGSPTLYQVDEFALMATLPHTEDEAKRDLFSLRKQNVSLMLAIHSLVNIMGNNLGWLIEESCKTRFLLANPAAQEPEIAKLYRQLGSTDPEIRDIATMRAQGEYYLQQTYQNIPRRRRFTVPFRGPILACCGSSSPADHALMDQLLREGHVPGVDFAEAFLRAKGCIQEADALRQEVAHAAD